MVVFLMPWNTPHTFPTLHHDEVHLWLTSLTKPQQEVTRFWETLNQEEKRRADRLISLQHRDNFIVARGTLRQLLANYLNCKAYEIEFVQGSFGKISIDPHMLAFANNKANMAIKFNLSHTSQSALFGFALERDLGVDIELMRTNLEVEEIAQRFFSPAEINTLTSLPKEALIQAFFNCWTRKEAFIKAIGKGLSYPLDEFEVEVAACGETKVALHVHDRTLQDNNWSLFSLEATPNCAAALVVEGAIEQEKLLKFAL